MYKSKHFLAAAHIFIFLNRRGQIVLILLFFIKKVWHIKGFWHNVGNAFFIFSGRHIF